MTHRATPGLNSPLSLFRWNQSFIQCVKKFDEASCIVWADMWPYVAKDAIIGDGSTHGDIGAPLTWHCNSGPLSDDVPPACPHFREVEAGFMCDVPLQLRAPLFTKRQKANS